MKRKIIAILLLIAAFTLFCAACTPQKTDDFDPDAITIVGKKTDLEKLYIRRIFEKYKSETGENINIIKYEDAEFEEKASKDFKDGKGADILMHFHNSDLNRFDIVNDFVYLNDESWVSDLTDSALAYCTNNGNVLGLPFWESSVSGCYYNKKILKSEGLDPAATQLEFDALCNTLSRDYAPICWPANGCTWMYQFGLDPVFADDPELLAQLNDGEITYADIPAVENMITWLNKAKNSGWFGTNYRETGWDDISTALSSGECVMTFIWDTWFYTDFKPDKYTVDDFALMPVFMNTADGGTYEGGNLNMMMLNKNGEKLDKAKEFLSFCATPENYNYAFDGISTVSCFKGQTTNIESQMVTEARASIGKLERVSTAATKIVGYSAEDVAAAVNSLFDGNIDVKGCITQMDHLRLDDAQKQHASK